MQAPRSRSPILGRARLRDATGPNTGRSAAKGSRESGSVLVEFALVAPLLFLVLFGIIEFGLVFKDSLTLTNMTRAGTRIGAEVGNASDPDADYQILSAIEAASSPLTNQIQGVIIFKASATSSALPPGCSLDSPGGVAGECNVYTPGQLQDVYPTWQQQQAQDPTSFECQPNWDSQWCPSARVVSQSGNDGSGPDYLGVYISVHETSVTGWFHAMTLDDAAVMRLEPQTP